MVKLGEAKKRKERKYGGNLKFWLSLLALHRLQDTTYCPQCPTGDSA